jgi:Pyruvate/2-oxoacid:ferredoxin oxidoreductase gamma subunit
MGSTRVTNVVLLGALSVLLPVEAGVWESVLVERVPSHFTDLNLRAFRKGRESLQERTENPCESSS